MESSPPNPKDNEEVFTHEETPDEVQEQDSHTPLQQIQVTLGDAAAAIDAAEASGFSAEQEGGTSSSEALERSRREEAAAVDARFTKLRNETLQWQATQYEAAAAAAARAELNREPTFAPRDSYPSETDFRGPRYI